MDITVSKYGHLKYTLKLADFVALGAVTSGDITLDNLPPGVLVTGWSIKPPAIFAAPSLSAATVGIKLNTTAKGTPVSVFTNANGTIDTTVAADGLVTSPTVLKAAVALTGANASALTAAQVDIIVNYTVLAP